MSCRIVEVTAENLGEHPQVICFINPGHELHHLKVDWLEQQFRLGLKIKLLYLEGQKRPAGFIEYVPGEHCWRAVAARGYLFIQCLWTNGKSIQHQGLGARLLEAAEEDAAGLAGVAALTSDASFMADRRLFLKQGYRVAAKEGKDQLLVKSFREEPLPSLNDWRGRLQSYRGLNIVYSRQCPWVARFIEEVKPVLRELDLRFNVIELKSPAEAQQAPAPYGVFSLILDGRLLADRYISVTRFRNIMKKELKSAG
jgi:hypothetical protein